MEQATARSRSCSRERGSQMLQMVSFVCRQDHKFRYAHNEHCVQFHMIVAIQKEGIFTKAVACSPQGGKNDFGG